jgi:ATP-binding cassette subfamily B protein
MLKPLYSLWLHFSKRRKIQAYFLFILMVVASILEVFSLGMVIPFLGVLSSPQKIFDSSYFQYTVYNFPILASINVQIVITVIFCIVATLAGFTRVLLMWVQTRFSHAIGADFSYAIYKRALFQPYSVHISRNSSEIISGIVNKSNGLLTFIVLPSLVLLSSFLMICFILATIILFNPIVALTTFGGFGLLYFIVMNITKKQLQIDAHRINENSTAVIKALQEGLGGIRDVLLDGTQNEYLKLYSKSDNPLRRSQANVQIISSAPRFIIEAIGLVFIGIIAFKLSAIDDGLLGAIPLLGLIALGAQRLLPLMQQSYLSFVNLRAGAPMLIDVLRLLESKKPENDYHFNKLESDALEFRKCIDIEGISFAYENSDQFVFSNLNISIPKGSRVGIVGKTGCGKSTFCDVLMGLLLPSEGCIKIDGLKLNASNIHLWQKHQYFDILPDLLN